MHAPTAIIALSGGDKAIVIYIDVLFGINLVMDFIVLFLVNRICKYAATYLRILLSATLGAVWSVAAVIMPDSIQSVVHICTYVFISFFMIKICAGKSQIRELIKGVVTLFGVTFLLAGCIHMLYYYTYAGYWMKQILLSDSRLLLFTAASLFLIYLIYVQYMRIRVYGSGKCRVCILANGKEIWMEGFVDTGNVLTDPYNHMPVSVAEKAQFDALLREINDYTSIKYHLVPYQSLGCENGLLEVITVDAMYIYQGKKKRKIAGALVGLSKTALSADGEYQMLLNAQLLV